MPRNIKISGDAAALQVVRKARSKVRAVRSLADPIIVDSPPATPGKLGGNGAPHKIPLIRPNPPRLSTMAAELAEIEERGIFSNYGPVNTRFERQLVDLAFGGKGACVTVANATLGLMLAIKQAAGWQPRGRYAIMPSFTFAAAAHAVLWCGLTPLLCDIDPETWLPDPKAEEALLRHHGKDIAVIIPNATFGNCLDLAHYDRLSATYDVPVVIDGAASLGSLDADGHQFGMNCAHPLVFSLHATKTFATAEAGVIYTAKPEVGDALRAMGNFGFGQPRTATMPGLNTKLSEVSALLALTKLQDLETIAEHRHARYELYRTLLPGHTFQHMTGQRMAHQFVPVLIPEAHKGRGPQIVAELAGQGIGAGRYFVPHLAQQPFFQTTCLTDDLSVTEAISERIVALPMSDFLTAEEVADVCDAFRQICPRQIARPASPGKARAGEERVSA